VVREELLEPADEPVEELVLDHLPEGHFEGGETTVATLAIGIARHAVRVVAVVPHTDMAIEDPRS